MHQLLPCLKINSQLLHAAHMISWFRSLEGSSSNRDHSATPHARATRRKLLVDKFSFSHRGVYPFRLVDCGFSSDHSIVYLLLQKPPGFSLYPETYFIAQLHLLNYPWKRPIVTIFSALPHPLFQSGIPLPLRLFGRWHPSGSFGDVVGSIVELLSFSLPGMNPSDDLPVIDTVAFPEGLFIDSQDVDLITQEIHQIVANKWQEIY